MIIDSHSLVGCKYLGVMHTAERQIAAMDEAGIDKAVITHLQPTGEVIRSMNGRYTKVNEFIADSVKKYPDRLIGFLRTNVHLGEQALKDIEYGVKTLGLSGLKLHPVIDYSSANSKIVHPLIELASKFEIPVCIHSWEAPQSHPCLIGDLAEMFPKATFILGHMGGFEHLEDTCVVVKKHDNMLVNTASVPSAARIKIAVDALGAEKVLFGVDLPFGDYKVDLAKVECANLTEKQKQAVLGGNIARVLKLKLQRRAPASNQMK